MPTKITQVVTPSPNVLPDRTPRIQASGQPDSASIQQALTRQAETIDSILNFLNAAFVPTASTRATGSRSSTANPQDVTLAGKLNVAHIEAQTGYFVSDSTTDNTVTAIENDPTGTCFTAIPQGGGDGWRVTKPDNSANVATCDSTGKLITSGPYDVTGNSIVRGSLRVTGAVTSNTGGFSSAQPAQGFGAPLPGFGDGDTGTTNADAGGEVMDGGLTVDGPTNLNDTLNVTAPATFTEPTTFTDITASGTTTLSNTQVQTQQVSESSHIMGASQVDGDSTTLGSAYFGGFGTPGQGDGMTPLATASVINGVITATDINSTGTITTGAVVASGDIQSATVHATSATITNITNTNLSSTTATITTANITNLNTNGTTVSGGNVTASDIKSTTAEISGALTAGSASVGSLSSTGAISGATLAISGNSTLAGVTASTVSASGALSGNTLSIATTASITGAASVGSLQSSGAVTAGSMSTTGSISGATLTISGTSTLGLVNAGNLTAGATTLNSLGVTFATTTNTLTVNSGSTLNGGITVAGGATISGGATVNGLLQTPNGISSADVLTTTLETTGAASIGTNISVGGNETVVGSVTTANILAAAGYLTALPQAHYYDTAYVAATNKICQYIFWNVSGNNGILGTGIGSTAYAAPMDWAYVAPVAGSLSAITGYVFTNSAATVTVSLYVNGTSAFSGTTTTTAATRKYFALTSTRGTLAFTAGAYLQLYVKSSVAQTNFYTLLTPHVYL